MNIRCNPRMAGLFLLGVSSVVSPISQDAVWDTYSLFEKASGSRLNQYESKGLWLGSWVGRLDPPVVLDWSPTKLKIRGVYVGLDNLGEDNWCPRINAVEKNSAFLASR